jgi:hypothetical protein
LDNIFNNRAISSLNLANNNIGQLVLPEGWRAEEDDGEAPWIHTDGQRVEDGMPGGSTPVGVIALANVIPDMEALSSLNLADNNLGALVLPEGWEEEDGVFCGPDDEEQCDRPPGSSPAGIIAVANAIKDMGALSCKGGGYYHEWSLNPDYHEAGSFVCPTGHSLLEFQTPSASFKCDGGEGCPDQGSHYPVGTSLFGCRICNFDFCSQCVATAKIGPKYISTAPDVEGADEDPGAPLSNGMCLHCGQSKEQHKAKRALTSLNIADNAIGGYYYNDGDTSDLIATPEGMDFIVLHIHASLFLSLLISRSCCCCWCHQEHEDVDEIRYKQQQHQG